MCRLKRTEASLTHPRPSASNLPVPPATLPSIPRHGQHLRVRARAASSEPSRRSWPTHTVSHGTEISRPSGAAPRRCSDACQQHGGDSLSAARDGSSRRTSTPLERMLTQARQPAQHVPGRLCADRRAARSRRSSAARCRRVHAARQGQRGLPRRAGRGTAIGAGLPITLTYWNSLLTSAAAPPDIGGHRRRASVRIAGNELDEAYDLDQANSLILLSATAPQG